jgi:ribonucleotide reductase beta subunit family protein with ferritin-like domain
MATQPGNHQMLDEYQLKNNEESKLYQRAKREQWNAADLDWETGTTLDAVQRAAGANILSHFLYGEQASFLVCAQLLPLVKDMEARFYLATQIVDETRHVEAFSRYIQLLGKVQAPNDNIRELVDKLISVPEPEEKLVGMHLLLEGLALEVFHNTARSIKDPLLGQMLNKIVVDESRHIGFGTVYLKKLLAEMHPEKKAALVERQAEYGMLLAGLVIDEAESCAQFGLDLAKVTERNIRTHLHRLQEIGLLNRN